MLDLNRIYQGDCLEIMRGWPDECIDMTVTSPPYDSLRDYHGFKFDADATLRELFRITKPGGVVAWVVGDETINGSESLSSFKQAISAVSSGWRLHDTMIWNKGSFSAVGALVNRYAPVFEYIFIFSKGAPKTFAPIKDKPNKHFGAAIYGTVREKKGETKPASCVGNLIPEFGQRFNIWDIPPEKSNANRFHPAMFPERLAADLISSWSAEGDIILDPFSGSGTTALCAERLGRKWIGCEISGEYADIARSRVAGEVAQGKLF